jgi:WD40 repeat protein
LAISADGKTALSGGADRVLRVWHVPTGKVLHTFDNFKDTVAGVAFLPGGNVVGCSGAGEIKVWELKELGGGR